MNFVLLEVSLDDLTFLDNQRDEKEGESGVTGSIVDELHSSNIQGY